MRDAIITFPIFGEGFALNPPRSFVVFGLEIYLYALFVMLGIVMGALYAMRRSKDFGLTQDNVLDFLFYGVPTALVCTRLFFVLFNLEHFIHDPLRIITGIRDGGLAIYGGVIGAVLGSYACSRIKKLDMRSFLDLGGLGLLIGQAIGRWGNFVNRELYGRETMLPWRMGLTTEAGTVYVHPAFLYEALWNVLGFILLHTYTKKVGRKYRGQIFILYLGWYGLGRAGIELLRDPSQNMFLFNTGIPVNLVMAIGCAVGAFTANYFLTRKPGEENEQKDEKKDEEKDEKKSEKHTKKKGKKKS